MKKTGKSLIKFMNFFTFLTILGFILSLPTVFFYAISIDEVLVLLAYIPLLILFIINLKFLKTKKKFFKENNDLNERLEKALTATELAASEY